MEESGARFPVAAPKLFESLWVECIVVNLKKCPFCGHQPDLNNGDTLYPTGTFWVDDPTIGIHYISRLDSQISGRGEPCWSFNCVESAGGCGAEVIGHSEQEAIEKWQRRIC